MNQDEMSPSEEDDEELMPSPDEPTRKRRKVRKLKRRIGDKDGEIKFVVDEAEASPMARRIIFICLGLMMMGMIGGGIYMLTSKTSDGTVKESEQDRLIRIQKEEAERISETLKHEPMDFEKALEYEVDLQTDDSSELLIIGGEEETAPTESDE